MKNCSYLLVLEMIVSVRKDTVTQHPPLPVTVDEFNIVDHKCVLSCLPEKDSKCVCDGWESLYSQSEDGGAFHWLLPTHKRKPKAFNDNKAIPEVSAEGIDYAMKTSIV